MKNNLPDGQKHVSRNPFGAAPPISLLALLSLTLVTFPIRAQTGTTAGTPAPALLQFDSSDFPLWGKDLRRAEIIAFGTFPFTMFTATFFMDTWRTSNHNWDTRYAPWPFKTAGAIDMTGEEHEITMAAAGIASLVLALTDFIIIQVKRYKAQQRILQMPPGSPIIIKRPWPEDVSEDQGAPPDASGETAESANPAEDSGSP
jgi:hypothetical protein